MKAQKGYEFIRPMYAAVSDSHVVMSDAGLDRRSTLVKISAGGLRYRLLIWPPVSCPVTLANWQGWHKPAAVAGLFTFVSGSRDLQDPNKEHRLSESLSLIIQKQS